MFFGIECELVLLCGEGLCLCFVDGMLYMLMLLYDCLCFVGEV